MEDFEILVDKKLGMRQHCVLAAQKTPLSWAESKEM